VREKPGSHDAYAVVDNPEFAKLSRAALLI